MTIAHVAFIVAAYLLGAVPFGLLIARARGIDIRRHGSGNIGATNVGRVLGRGWGLLCLALDILKGLLPSAAFGWYAIRGTPDTTTQIAWLLVATGAVLGHNFPIYLGFRGGKGVATTIGVALGVYPYYTWPIVAALLVYGVARRALGFVSVGSLALAVTFPPACVGYLLIRGEPLGGFVPLLGAACGLGLLIILRHRENISRLRRGTEHAVRGATPPTCPPSSAPTAPDR